MLFGGGRKRFGQRQGMPPSMYGTRDPAKILMANEAANAPAPEPVPSAIGGYGGGTFDSDGSQATSVSQGEVMERPPLPSGGTLGNPHGVGPLGGSMRQSFDYDAAMKALAGDQRKPKWWNYALAGLGDALVRNGGGQPWAIQSLVGQQDAQRQRLNDAAQTLARWQYDDWSRQNEADLRAANPVTIGRNRVQFDPATGQSNVLYEGDQDAEIYAQNLGFEPGSEEYFAAIEDFVLRGSGPSAHERDLDLDDHRTANDTQLENTRYGNRLGLENLRQKNRMAMEGQRQSNRMTLRNTPSASRRRGGGSSLPVVSSPSEARRLPKGTRFRTPDGRVKVVN